MTNTNNKNIINENTINENENNENNENNIEEKSKMLTETLKFITDYNCHFLIIVCIEQFCYLKFLF